MKKLGIKSRVFISFFILIITIVNIFAYALYYSTKYIFIKNTYNSINNEYQTITTFIDLQSSDIFSLPKYEIEKINNLGFYFYIGNNDKKLENNYKLGFHFYENNLIFRGDYKGYNIIIGKNLTDYYSFKEVYFKILLLLNLILIIGTILISYFTTKKALKPLLELTNFLNNYNFNSKGTYIKNNYGKSEIGLLTIAINNFIKKNNSILESQTNFIQDVSHELKTPLMQINSNIELIEDKINNEKIIKKINLIKTSINNINEIISNLGFILRGEKQQIKKENINIPEYFSNFIKNYKSIAEEKNIKINLIINYNLELINNKYYLDRLFGNLLSNAIFYNNGNNNINIIINKDNIIIKDEGIGIEKEEIEKIFSRFYRNRNSGKYYPNGNGLGLVIVKKIINIFGWKLNINSEINKGTEIIITL